MPGSRKSPAYLRLAGDFVERVLARRRLPTTVYAATGLTGTFSMRWRSGCASPAPIAA